uniref:Homeobox-containing protein n=1 Tax=Strongyloides stercoralis TaxID=6248 RepID=A0A0K0E7T9_STRER
MDMTENSETQSFFLTDRSSCSSMFETEITPSYEEYFYNENILNKNQIPTEKTASLYSSKDDDSCYSNCDTANPFNEDDFMLIKKMEDDSNTEKIHICLYEESKYLMNPYEKKKNPKQTIEEPQSSYCLGNNYYCGMEKEFSKKNVNSQYQLKDLINYNLMEEGKKTYLHFNGVESQYVLDNIKN